MLLWGRVGHHVKREASRFILSSLPVLSYFGKGAMCQGTGGSIPFMSMLGEKFPRAQFLITGVLGPESNAHGPNEFLHVPTGVRLTACVAQVLAEHYTGGGRPD